MTSYVALYTPSSVFAAHKRRGRKFIFRYSTRLKGKKIIVLFTCQGSTIVDVGTTMSLFANREIIGCSRNVERQSS